MPGVREAKRSKVAVARAALCPRQLEFSSSEAVKSHIGCESLWVTEASAGAELAGAAGMRAKDRDVSESDGGRFVGGCCRRARKCGGTYAPPAAFGFCFFI